MTSETGNRPRLRGTPEATRPGPWAGGGFTLVEIVVAITIVVVLAGVVIPTVKGFQDEDRARKPMEEFALLVQEVRERAAREHRAYQIVFTAEGIHALPYDHPYDDHERFMERLEELERPAEATRIVRGTVTRGNILREAAAEAGNGTGTDSSLFVDWFDDGLPREDSAPPRPWHHRGRVSEGVEYEILPWGEPEWIEMDGSEFRRWIIQPRGLVRPLRIRFSRRDAFFEAGVDPLTGELVNERSSVAPSPPARPGGVDGRSSASPGGEVAP